MVSPVTSRWSRTALVCPCCPWAAAAESRLGARHPSAASRSIASALATRRGTPVAVVARPRIIAQPLVLIGCRLERREGQDFFVVIKVAVSRADGIVGTRTAAGRVDERRRAVSPLLSQPPARRPFPRRRVWSVLAMGVGAGTARPPSCSRGWTGQRLSERRRRSGRPGPCARSAGSAASCSSANANTSSTEPHQW
jgi:hypothetical protein